MKILKLEDVNVYYRKSHILRDVSFHVDRGEIVALLGRNGVGKTVTLKSIMGLVKASGRIIFDGMDISHIPSYKIPGLGIGYVPQRGKVFPYLSVKENLKMVSDASVKFDLFPSLKEKLNQPAGTLSAGEQQMLAMVRALTGKPKMLLLDEPFGGLMPSLMSKVKKAIRLANQDGVSVLLVEQNIKEALKLCDRVLIMERGAVTWQGKPQEIEEVLSNLL
jgi:branched-chain amino acid transport system ATP-binding protein